MSTPTIQGHVEPGFERVADAFALNFTDRGDRGAACAVVVEGRTVIDLHGGHTAAGQPWTEATRTPVFSVSKGITAICLTMASDRGLLDLDAPVAFSWPEFAAHGKGQVTVREALAHRAGVPTLSWPATGDDLHDWHRVVDDLARAVPLWTPGTRFAYHALTVGFLAGEVLRRTTGRRPSQWLADEIAGPLGLTMTFGGDPDDPDFAAPLPLADTAVGGVPLAAEDQALVDRALLADGAYAPDLYTAAGTAAFLGPESPAANLVTRAKDLARLYAATVHPVDGRTLLTAEMVAAASRPLSFGKPYVGADKGDVWGTGFMLHSARRGMAGPGSFGHDGAGGQLAFAQPRFGLGFGYHTIQPGGDDDIRAEALSAALRECL